MPMTFMVRQIESMPAMKRARGRGRPDLIPDEAIDAAIRMREEGAFWRDISAAVGASSTGIRKAVERRNEAADEACRSGSVHSHNN